MGSEAMWYFINLIDDFIEKPNSRAEIENYVLRYFIPAVLANKSDKDEISAWIVDFKALMEDIYGVE